MANTIRIKRRASGAPGAPTTLANAELAYNEVDDVLYYGKGSGGANGTATSIVTIGGNGAYINISGTQTISGSKTFTGSVNLTGATVSGFTTTGAVVIGGDLTVNGTTTTINSVSVSTDDKNIELGATTSPSDATADTGGITLKGTTDKTILWLDATDAWTFNQNVELAATYAYRIDGVSVLSKTTLGSTVVGSSLTSLGTIATGVWQSTAIGSAYGGTGYAGGYANGEILIGTSTGGLIKSTLSAGPGISITNSSGGITITSSISGNVTIASGGTGAATAADARTNLGLAIGSNVQAWDADLDTLSGLQTGAATALSALTSTEVSIIDGSSTATATTLTLTDRLVVNDGGTMVQVALSDLITLLEDGVTSGFDLDGGTY